MQCPEKSVALNFAPVFVSELLVANLQASAQGDQNVDDPNRVVNWCVFRERGPSLLVPDVEDSSQKKLAKLTELAPNNFFHFPPLQLTYYEILFPPFFFHKQF